MQPVLRFAPSPNGLLHLGHAFSALVNAAIARRLGGRLLLRIEDIDPGRSRPEYEAAIHRDLAWLGLTFETPVLRQSEHMADYARALDALKARRLVYRCFCSRADTARFVAAREASGVAWPRDPDGAPFHAGRCAELPGEEAARLAQSGRPHSWRLRMVAALAACSTPLDWTVLDEEAREIGRRRARPEDWDDVVIARRDVPTSYHLSVVIDDARQGITHVVRGRDLERSTDVHRLLQALLGLPTPSYHHHRLVEGEDGKKLAKSRGSEALAALREAGWSAADVARRLGFDPDDANVMPAGPARDKGRR